MSAPDRRSMLRSATLQAHARLDAMADQAGFFDSRSSYTAYLMATWRVRSGLELSLDARAQSVYALWPQRRIIPALRLDLLCVTGIEQGDFVSADRIPLGSLAQTLGVLYVLEGSALGARILLGRAAALGMTPDFGASHLAAQTSMPGAWKNFLSVLEAEPLDLQQEDLCVAAALATFERFEREYGSAFTVR